MSKVIDLTRRRQDGKLRTISKKANALNATYAANPLPAFLQEVDLGTIRACYFVVGLSAKEKSFYYDLGWLKLPAGFQLVEYTVNNGQATFDYKDENKVNEAILTPLLLLYKGRETGTEAHICNIFKPESSVGTRGMVGNANGCSVTLLPIREQVLDTTPIKQSNLPFYIFSYDGHLSINPQHEKLEGGCFLMPVILSERTIVYYAFPKSEFMTHYNASLGKKFAEIDSPLVLNDQIGIFVTNKILWQ